MKDLNLLVWLTQLGLSVVSPLAGFTLLSVWLRDSCGWGEWVVPVGIILGIFFAAAGLRGSLQTLLRISERKKKEDAPPVAFNDHD